MFPPKAEMTASCCVQLSFDVSLKVNMFEANIRLLGGLLSAHLLASDTSRGLMQTPYSGQLLEQATDLGDRLMAAFFASRTGMAASLSCCFWKLLIVPFPVDKGSKQKLFTRFWLPPICHSYQDNTQLMQISAGSICHAQQDMCCQLKLASAEHRCTLVPAEHACQNFHA